MILQQFIQLIHRDVCLHENIHSLCKIHNYYFNELHFLESALCLQHTHCVLQL